MVACLPDRDSAKRSLQDRRQRMKPNRMAYHARSTTFERSPSAPPATIAVEAIAPITGRLEPKT
jgi:hypothetical protein